MWTGAGWVSQQKPFALRLPGRSSHLSRSGSRRRGMSHLDKVRVFQWYLGKRRKSFGPSPS